MLVCGFDWSLLAADENRTHKVLSTLMDAGGFKCKARKTG